MAMSAQQAGAAGPADESQWRGQQGSGPMEEAPSSQAPCKRSNSQRLPGIEEEPPAGPPPDYRQHLYSLLGPERAEYFLSPPALERCRTPGEQGLLEAVGGALAGTCCSHAQDAAGGTVEAAATCDAPAGGAAPGRNQPAAGQGAARRPQRQPGGAGAGPLSAQGPPGRSVSRGLLAGAPQPMPEPAVGEAWPGPQTPAPCPR